VFQEPAQSDRFWLLKGALEWQTKCSYKDVEKGRDLTTRTNWKSEKSTLFCGRVVAVTVLCIAFSGARAQAAPQGQGARTLFNSTCASCHGQNGTPTTVGKSLNAPDLGSPDVQKHTNEELQEIISNGKGNMPPFKGTFSDAQISSLIAYVRSFSKQHK
jgi:cytochrome c6